MPFIEEKFSEVLGVRNESHTNTLIQPDALQGFKHWLAVQM